MASKGLLNIGSRVFNSRASSVGAVGLGLGIAMNQKDMGTWAMDLTEDTLLGTTSADEVFTGGQRSITSPFSYRSSPLRYVNDAVGSYRKAMDVHPVSIDALSMRAGNRRYNQTPNQAVDGSMVFGMYNLRR